MPAATRAKARWPTQCRPSADPVPSVQPATAERCQDQPMATAELLTEARELLPATVLLRRTIHRNPEQGLQLPATQAAVVDALADLPLRVHTGTSTTSVVAVLDGARPGPTVLL